MPVFADFDDDVNVFKTEEQEASSQEEKNDLKFLTDSNPPKTVEDCKKKEKRHWTLGELKP